MALDFSQDPGLDYSQWSSNADDGTGQTGYPSGSSFGSSYSGPPSSTPSTIPSGSYAPDYSYGSGGDGSGIWAGINGVSTSKPSMRVASYPSTGASSAVYGTRSYRSRNRSMIRQTASNYSPNQSNAHGNASSTVPFGSEFGCGSTVEPQLAGQLGMFDDTSLPPDPSVGTSLYNINQAISAYHQTGSPKHMFPDVASEVQQNYDTLNVMGYWSTDAGCLLGHNLRASGLVHDPSQGTAFTEKPSTPPRKTILPSYDWSGGYHFDENGNLVQDEPPHPAVPGMIWDPQAKAYISDRYAASVRAENPATAYQPQPEAGRQFAKSLSTHISNLRTEANQGNDNSIANLAFGPIGAYILKQQGIGSDEALGAAANDLSSNLIFGPLAAIGKEIGPEADAFNGYTSPGGKGPTDDILPNGQTVDYNYANAVTGAMLAPVDPNAWRSDPLRTGLTTATYLSPFLHGVPAAVLDAVDVGKGDAVVKALASPVDLSARPRPPAPVGTAIDTRAPGKPGARTVYGLSWENPDHYGNIASGRAQPDIDPLLAAKKQTSTTAKAPPSFSMGDWWRQALDLGSKDSDVLPKVVNSSLEGKTLTEWLSPNNPELLHEAHQAFVDGPEWQGIDPDNTKVFYRSQDAVKAIRKKSGESGGHHPHGLALGGPEGQILTPTGEAGRWKNPTHSIVTGLQRRLIKEIRRQSGR